MEIIYALIGLLVGGGGAFAVLNSMFKNKQNEQIAKDNQTLIDLNKKINEASDELRKRERESDKMLDKAREKSKQIKDDANSLKVKAESKLENLEFKEKELEKKNKTLDSKIEKVDEKISSLRDKEKEKEQEISTIREQKLQELEKITSLSKEQAKEAILSEVKNLYSDSLVIQTNKLETEMKGEIEKKAKKMIGMAIQRFAGEVASEHTTTTVPIESDDIKGKIIGKEGRNIHAFESATGVDLIIDDTPNCIVISGFDLFRRYIAKQSILKLIEDGRIHPARIEEIVTKTRQEANQMLTDLGQKALQEMGIAGIHPELVKITGRLRFRTSYGQNILKHSMEVGGICATLAAEMGVDTEKARMAGFFHDIGKAVDHEVEGGHAVISYEILKRYNIPEDIAHAAGAHHEEMPIESPLDFIVCAGDAISGARPGARRESLESYIKRLKTLEDIATSYDGVERAFAIQAGREVRVMVNPGEVDDFRSKEIAIKIASKIERDMSYPGQIKVNVIRENRIEEYAK